jgi:hypothetical protein
MVLNLDPGRLIYLEKDSFFTHRFRTRIHQVVIQSNQAITFKNVPDDSYLVECSWTYCSVIGVK